MGVEKTLKRQTLERNLKRVISRIEEGIAPLHIVEVWVFGSFLRPKAEPGDVDVVLFYEKDPKFDNKVEAFRRIIWDHNGTKDGRQKIEYGISNQLFEKTFPGLPVDVWLRNIKVSYRKEIRYHFEIWKTTRKVLTEGFRGIQISTIEDVQDKDDYFSRKRAQSFKLVWSENERDVDKNLQQSNEEQVTLVLSEMKNFAVQVEYHKSYYYVLANTLKWIIENIQWYSRLPDDEQLAERVRIVGNERGILEPYLNWILSQYTSSRSVDRPGLREKVTSLDIDSEIAQIKESVKDVFELDDLCESMREDIDEFSSRCIVAETLLGTFVYIRDRGEHIFPLEEWIPHTVRRTLNGVPKNEANDAIKRRVLTDLDLDEISKNIILVETAGYRSAYHFAKSEEELQELINYAKKGKAEKEYAKDIRPILRKAFTKNAKTHVNFSTVIGENGVAIPQRVRLSTFSQGQDIDKNLYLAKKLGFTVDVSVQWGEDVCRAKRTIDISYLNGDRKKIKNLIESVLHVQPTAPFYVVD